MDEWRTSVPRLKLVHFKDGRASIEVIRRLDVNFAKAVRAEISRVISLYPEPDGMAIVLWDADSSAAGFVVGGRSKQTAAMVPVFAYQRLMAELIERWTQLGLEATGDI